MKTKANGNLGCQWLCSYAEIAYAGTVVFCTSSQSASWEQIELSKAKDRDRFSPVRCSSKPERLQDYSRVMQEIKVKLRKAVRALRGFMRVIIGARARIGTVTPSSPNSLKLQLEFLSLLSMPPRFAPPSLFHLGDIAPGLTIPNFLYLDI